MQSSLAVRSIVSKDQQQKQRRPVEGRANEMHSSKLPKYCADAAAVDKPEKEKPIDWGSDAFALMLNEQKTRLVSAKPNPKKISRSESLPTRLSPFIERRTVLELAQLLEGRIPIPLCTKGEAKQENQRQESSLSLAEQLSRQMNRLNVVYTPNTKQKMFLQRSASMPSSSPVEHASEVSTPRASVAELSAVLQFKIPQLAKATNEAKKVHSKNAASSTTSFVATKIDNYVDTATRRCMFQRAESMPLNQSVRQLADQLKHRIPMAIPHVSQDKGLKFTRSNSSPEELATFSEEIVEKGGETSQSVREHSIQAARNRRGSKRSNVSPLKKSKSVAELSLLLKDRFPIRGNRLHIPDTLSTQPKSSDNGPVHSVGKSGMRAAEIADQIQKGAVLDLASYLKDKITFSKHLSYGSEDKIGVRSLTSAHAAEAFRHVRQGTVQDVASELRNKLVFRVQKDRCIRSGLHSPLSKPIRMPNARAEEAAEAIGKDLVRTVAQNLKNKLVFRSNESRSQRKEGSTKDLQLSSDRNAEVSAQVRPGSVCAVALNLESKLQFRTGGVKTAEHSAPTLRATSSFRNQAFDSIPQERYGSVKAVAATLKEKLFFKLGNDETRRATKTPVVADKNDSAFIQKSSLNAVRNDSEATSVAAVSLVLKERLMFRSHQTAAPQREPARTVEVSNLCRKNQQGTNQVSSPITSQRESSNIAPTDQSCEIHHSNAVDAAMSATSPTTHCATIKQSGKFAVSPSDFPSKADHEIIRVSNSLAVRPIHELRRNCALTIDPPEVKSVNNKRPRCIDSSTQTDVSPRFPPLKSAPALNPVAQQRAMIQWRKRIATRSVVKRPPSKTIVFSSYGKESNSTVRKMPKRRWNIPPLPPMARHPGPSTHEDSQSSANGEGEKKKQTVDSDDASRVVVAARPSELGTKCKETSEFTSTPIAKSGKATDPPVENKVPPKAAVYIEGGYHETAEVANVTDGSGEVAPATDRAGAGTTVTYGSGDGEVTTVADQVVNVGEMTVETAGEVASVTDRAGEVAVAIDGTGEVINAALMTTEACEMTTVADGITAVTPGATERTAVADGAGEVTTLANRSGSQVISTTKVASVVATVTDEAGDVITTTKAPGAVTAMVNDIGSGVDNVETSPTSANDETTALSTNAVSVERQAIHKPTENEMMSKSDSSLHADGSSKTDRSTSPKKQRPPLSSRRRKLPIIDPMETALCQVFVGQSFRDSFRESSQRRIVVQDPLDSAITDLLADTSNRSWRSTKRVVV